MTNSTKLLFQVGEETFEPTGEVLEQYKADLESSVALESQKQAKAEAKSAVLDRLGITEEEARLLLG